MHDPQKTHPPLTEDEILRRMLNTPPKQHAEKPAPKPISSPEARKEVSLDGRAPASVMQCVSHDSLLTKGAPMIYNEVKRLSDVSITPDGDTISLNIARRRQDRWH